VLEVIHERNRIRLRTTCANQRGEDVLSGEAWVMPSGTHIVYEEERGVAASLVRLALRPWSWAAQALAAWATMVTSAARR